jgi:hypothetical protein
MSGKHADRLALAHLSLIDIQRVQRGIEHIRGSDDKYMKDVLFRDAVISYAKPFRDNRHSDGSRGLRISDKCIPKELREVHEEILALRDKLIAHTDMTILSPRIEKREDELGNNYSMIVSGYDTIHREHLIDPLLALAKAVYGGLLDTRSDQTKYDF